MSGGKKGKPITIGFWYHLGVQVAVCHGKIDSVTEFIFGENSAWKGEQTANGNVIIDAKNLFGGETREGGVYGNISIYLGDNTQGVDPYVAAFRGATTAQRGLVTCVFGQVGQSTPAQTITNIDYANSLMKKSVVEKLQFIHPIAVQAVDSLTKTKAEIEDLYAITTLTKFYTGEHKNENMWANQVIRDRKAANGGSTRAALMECLYRIIVVNNLPATVSHVRLTKDEFFESIATSSTVNPEKKNSTPFTWSAMNPYFKPVWIRVRCIRKGWDTANGECWYPDKAVIMVDGVEDMNPAHIIYKVLTSQTWGMGYTPSDIDEASFKKAADTLYNEGFGLSFAWRQESTIEEFINIILKHIDATLSLDINTGKFKLTLIRSDYNINHIPELNEFHISSIDSFERSSWGDTPNEIVLTYRDRNDDPAVVAVQNMAAIQSQGGRISTTAEYVGIHSPTLAARVAERDLRVSTTPLAKVTLKVNRASWAMQAGDVFALSWEAYNLDKVAFRILTINKGSFTDGMITITAIEDIFGLPYSTYIQREAPKWQDPYQSPAPIKRAQPVEMGYYDMAQIYGDDDVKPKVERGDAHVMFLADSPSALTVNYLLDAANTNAIASYKTVASNLYNPNFELLDSIDELTGTIAVGYIEGNVSGLDFNTDYIMVGDEAMKITAIDQNRGIINVARGILDTIPAKHGAGSLGFFTRSTFANDVTTRARGETVYYRPRAVTTRGTQSLTEANIFNLRLEGRAQRPYPPRNILINGKQFPTDMTGDKITITYATANRFLQTNRLTEFFAGGVTSEPDVKYYVKLNDSTFEMTGGSFTLGGIGYVGYDTLPKADLAERVTFTQTKDNGGTLVTDEKYGIYTNNNYITWSLRGNGTEGFTPTAVTDHPWVDKAYPAEIDRRINFRNAASLNPDGGTLSTCFKMAANYDKTVEMCLFTMFSSTPNDLLASAIVKGTKLTVMYLGRTAELDIDPTGWNFLVIATNPSSTTFRLNAQQKTSTTTYNKTMSDTAKKYAVYMYAAYGQNWQDKDKPFKGLICERRVYTRKLNDAEIKLLANQPAIASPVQIEIWSDRKGLTSWQKYRQTVNVIKG